MGMPYISENPTPNLSREDWCADGDLPNPITYLVRSTKILGLSVFHINNEINHVNQEKNQGILRI